MRIPSQAVLVLCTLIALSACSGAKGTSSLPDPGRVSPQLGNQDRAVQSIGGPACNVPADYPTIQAAVSVPTCTTVNVAAGSYTENVTIGHALTLRGAQAGRDARTRHGAESTINGGAGPNITITANGVTVDGFTLNGPVSQGTAAIVMMGANSGETIRNVIVNNPGRAASFNTSNTTFQQNLVNNTPTAGDGFQANTNAVQNVTLADNAFHGATAANYNADITIIEGNANIVVTRNASERDGTLIALFKTNGATISDNVVLGDPSSSAVYIGGGDSNVTVTTNAIGGASSAVNVANDFGVGPNSTVTITQNLLRNNVNGVKVGSTAATTANTVAAHRNGLTGNSGFGVDNLSPANVDATCNWWGSKNGPGPVGPGSGDKVTPNVTYSPWLKSPSLESHCGGVTNGHGHGEGDDDDD